jgi:hypothetical protein
LTIDVWSDEDEFVTGYYRLPNMVQMYSGPVLLATGRNDSTIQYLLWDPEGDGWEGPYLLFSGTVGNNILTALGSDPNQNRAYYMTTSAHLLRYQGGTGPWEYGFHPVWGNRTATCFVDASSRFHFLNNTQSAFGFITHYRSSTWPQQLSDYDIQGNYFPEAVNSLYLTEGNIITDDGAGNYWVAYCKDNSLSPYLGYPPYGPRYIRVTPIPGGGLAAGYTTVEMVSGVGIELDSPAISRDPSGDFHVAYRIWDTGDSEWQIRYEVSTNGGNSYSPGPDIFTGSTEPTPGYVYLISDGQGDLHAMYSINNSFEYRTAPGGTSWSDIEVVDPGVGSDDDFHPKMFVTSDDILHVTWVRGNAGAGYGNLVHRMRDLD